MKYIRTEDGIIIEMSYIESNPMSAYEGFKIIKDKIYHKVTTYQSGANFVRKCKLWATIVKQADTVEELCDVFVLDCVNKSLNNIFRDLIDARLFGSYSERKHEYYGAIWIVGEHGEPILKSVARINEKGELELL